MNWIEAQIKSVQDSIAWHEDRGLNCDYLKEQLEALLKRTGQ